MKDLIRAFFKILRNTLYLYIIYFFYLDLFSGLVFPIKMFF